MPTRHRHRLLGQRLRRRLGNDRIQKFDSSGTFLTKWGSSGSGDGQFDGPVGVATDSSGNVYVADYDNHRIQKFDSSGTFLTKWGSYGSGDGQFDDHYGIATDSSGNVYVADNFNSRIQKFDSSGTFLAKWGSAAVFASGVATDAAGSVYVADRNGRIQKFDSSGTFLSQVGSTGSGDGQFNDPIRRRHRLRGQRLRRRHRQQPDPEVPPGDADHDQLWPLRPDQRHLAFVYLLIHRAWGEL